MSGDVAWYWVTLPYFGSPKEGRTSCASAVRQLVTAFLCSLNRLETHGCQCWKHALWNYWSYPLSQSAGSFRWRGGFRLQFVALVCFGHLGAEHIMAWTAGKRNLTRSLLKQTTACKLRRSESKFQMETAIDRVAQGCVLTCITTLAWSKSVLLVQWKNQTAHAVAMMMMMMVMMIMMMAAVTDDVEDVHSKTKGNRNRKKLGLEICLLPQEVTKVRNPGMNNLLLPDGQRKSNP